jgi:hypothetical protein
VEGKNSGSKTCACATGLGEQLEAVVQWARWPVGLPVCVLCGILLALVQIAVEQATALHCLEVLTADFRKEAIKRD